MISTNSIATNISNLNANNSQVSKTNNDKDYSKKSDFKDLMAKNVNDNKDIKNENQNAKVETKVDYSKDVSKVDDKADIKDEDCKILTKEEVENIIQDINKDGVTDDNKLLLLIASLMDKLKNLDNTDLNTNKGTETKEIDVLNTLLESSKLPKLNEAMLMKLNSANAEKISELKGVLASISDAIKSGNIEDLNKANPKAFNEFMNLLKNIDEKINPESLKDLNLADIKDVKDSLNALLNTANSKNVKTEKVQNDVLVNNETEKNQNVDVVKVINSSQAGDAGSKNASKETKKEASAETNKDYNTLKSIIEEPKDKQSNISIFAQRMAEVKNIEQPKEVQVINKNTMVMDIVKTVKYMSANDTKTLVVKMNPKDLGEITIKLVAQGESMKATITASNKETSHLLNNATAEIKKTLENQGIKMADVNIGLANEDTTFFSGESGFKRENNNAKENKSSNGLVQGDFEEEVEEEMQGSNNINMLA